jgi:hypothetical protein
MLLILIIRIQNICTTNGVANKTHKPCREPKKERRQNRIPLKHHRKIARQLVENSVETRRGGEAAEGLKKIINIFCTNLHKSLPRFLPPELR